MKSHDSMTFAEFTEANKKRSGEWKTLEVWSLSDWMVATLGELGEAANVVKKLNRIKHGLELGQKETQDDLQKQLELEIADTLTYLFCFAIKAGINLEKAVIEKFNIVSDRIGSDIQLNYKGETE